MVVIYVSGLLIGGNASVTLNLPCLRPERKVKWYNEYFINGYVFHIKEYG
jgi:hypothetical protein